MAYISKEDKEKIVAAVKSVLPKGWKASFRVRNHSGIVFTLKSTPHTLEELFKHDFIEKKKEHYTTKEGLISSFSLNNYHLESFVNPEFLGLFKKIDDALNTDNYDNSDSMSDYFDVGHYVYWEIGSENKPYIKK